MRRTVWILAFVSAVIVSGSLAAWSNGGKSPSLTQPIFGTHDYIAYRGYVMADRPTFIKNNLNSFYIGTEAPDTDMKPADAVGTYGDTAQCHCILFDPEGNVTKDRLELRTRQEFDKAVAALSQGKKKLAAFYAGAMAHYLGDLSQFCHVMGAQSHWGSENQSQHSAYEKTVDDTMNAATRSSSFLDPFIHPVTVTGNTPEEVARAAAKHTEDGDTGGLRPGPMNTKMKQLAAQNKLRDLSAWPQAFKDQTGRNVNVSVNAIAKLLRKINP